MRIAISSGHSHRDPGAVGILNERRENVRVADRLGHILNATPGSSAVVYHDETSTSSRQNVNETAAWHNRQSRDRDCQIHFNAFAPTPGPRGTEMLYRAAGNRALAARISAGVAAAGGFIDRGPKQRTDLGFLNQTQKPAILTEICFVDSTVDTTLYGNAFDAICAALAATLIDAATIPPITSKIPSTIRQGDRGDDVRLAQQLLQDLATDGIFGPLTDMRAREFQAVNPPLVVDGIIGPRTWTVLLDTI
jgi:hypothetical protein